MKTPKIAFYNIPFPRIRSYYDMIDLAAEYGLPAIEGFTHMELSTPDIEQAKRIREYADNKGIVCCCFSMCANIVENDSAEQIARIKQYTDVASVLGSPFIHHTIATTRDRSLLEMPQREVLFNAGIKGVREVYDSAVQKQIRAVYEDQGFLFNGLETFGRFLNEVDRNVGAVADFGNIHQMDEDIVPFIREYKDSIVHVHLKDMKPVTPEYTPQLPTWHGSQVAEVEIGSGVVDFVTALGLLRDNGYDGYYALEYSAERDNSPEIDNALTQVRKWLY